MAEELADLSLGEPSTTEYRAPRKKSVADILEAKEGEDGSIPPRRSVLNMSPTRSPSITGGASAASGNGRRKTSTS